jgi:hypothetical protein
VFGPVGALGEQRRPDGTSDGDVRGVHDPYRSGLVKVFGIELDRVSFLVVGDVSDWRIGQRFQRREGRVSHEWLEARRTVVYLENGASCIVDVCDIGVALPKDIAVG